MNTFYRLVGALGLISLSWGGYAQSPIQLRLAFNPESNRYEVFARPTFTDNHYNWGPSQVTVVLPGAVANVPISPRSTQAGVWLDQSAVYNPASAPDRDYHGFASQGGKVSLEADTDLLIFDFVLPQGYVEGVRLFNPTQDPNSAAPGMLGGDFSSYMTNHRGEQLLRINSESAPLIVSAKAIPEPAPEGDARVGAVVYPNPSPSGVVHFYLKGFNPTETVHVQFTNLTGKLLGQFDSLVEKLAGQPITIPKSTDPYVLVTVLRPSTQKMYNQKIWLVE